MRVGLLPLLLCCWTNPGQGALLPDDGPLDAPLHVEAPVASDAPALAPLELVDPDGQALTLDALTVNVAVEGMLSLTELELRFQNPQDRRVEGRFALTLPDGATVSRFAKEVNGQLVEGEVVERMAAHRAYDTILQQMRDPALLEQDAGNRFTAKIFPIEPRGEVRVVLSYTRLLRREDGARAYVLPLRGLANVGQFTFHGRFTPLPGEITSDLPGAERGGDGVQHLVVSKSDWAPDTDISVRWTTKEDAPRVQVLRSGDFYVASFQPDVAAAKAGPARWALYVDTSASAADAIAPRVAALTALLRSLPASTPVVVRAFDQHVAALDEGRAADVAARVGEKLQARGFLGGTNLGEVLADVAKEARTDTRVVLVTDGVPTFGETNPAKLAEAARALPARLQMHALVLGPEQDGALLTALTQGRGRVVEIPFSATLGADAARAADRLTRAPGARFDVVDAGAAWVHGAGAGDVLPGGEVIVVGRGKPSPRLMQGGDIVLASDGAKDAGDAGPLVEREAVRLHLLDLARRESEALTPEARAELADEQVALSTAHRVLSPKTTMLVLESEADYARFGLDRRALADILTVGPKGIAVAARTAPIPVEAPPSEPRKELLDEKAKKKDVADRDDGDMENKPEAKVSLADGMPEPDERAEEAPSDDAPMAEAAASPPPPPSPRPAQRAEPQPAPGVAASAPSESRSAPSPESGRLNGRDREASVERPPAREQKVSAPEWVNPPKVSGPALEALEGRLAAAPLDRAVYNQLADALLASAAWVRLDEVARAWQGLDPENPHVYELLGESALARGDKARAIRAFASLAEVAGGRPEMLQRAGLLLWRAGDPTAAEVPLRRALELRPDRANAWRHLALVLRETGRFAEAADVLEEARRRTFPETYQGVQRVLGEELGATWRAWIAAQPGAADDVRARAKASGVPVRTAEALRVTLAWETDGNDVDLHVVDPSGEVCFYSHKQNASGLELYEDLTRGLGPEVIQASKLPKGRYTIGVKYFSAGPMGVSRGLVIVEVAGKPARVEPFRLVEGGGDVRYIAAVEL